MKKQILYEYKDEGISIIIEVYFSDEKLVVEGYDFRKTVEEAWGDSDYEYSVTIAKKEVVKLYGLFGVAPDDKEGLIRKIADTYDTNTCYSEFGKFLDEHKIKADYFSWA